MNFTLYTPVPLISPSLHTHPLPCNPPPNRGEKILMWKLWCVSVNHSVSFCPNSSTCKRSFQEPLVWFEASGFCYTISAGSSPWLLSGIFLLPCVMKILQLWIYMDQPLHLPQQLIDGVDVGVGGYFILIDI